MRKWIFGTIKTAIVVTGLTVFALRPSSASTKRGLDCEEAAAHLAQCCDAGEIDICGVNRGCESEPPQSLSEQESTCLLEHDCAELQELGVCKRLDERMTGWCGNQSCPSGSTQAVCP